MPGAEHLNGAYSSAPAGAITINGARQPIYAGESLLHAIRSAGCELPTLCSDARVKPCGSCRMCLVEVEVEGSEHPGSSRTIASCTTPATDGLSIRTHTPALEAGRKAELAMLAERYPESAVREQPAKPFHRWLRHYGLTAKGADNAEPDLSHPYIRVRMSQCIDCYLCVRVCAELQGQFVWNIRERGGATRIVADDDVPFGASSCVSCGACVDVCPTGALEDKHVLERPAATSWTRTVCPYCGTGCELEAGAANGRLVSVRPTPGAPVNHGHLCVKGRFAFDYVHAPDRVTTPLLRQPGGEWKPVSWSDAIAHVAAEFTRIRRERGADAIGVLGSSRSTNEENYLAQKFARVAIGTNNVDCCARVCHAPTATAMGEMLGTGAATNSYDDIELARTILVCGANATENHPVIGARIRQAAFRGAQLIVIDPRRTELAAIATLHLAPRPGTNVALLNAIANVIVEEGLTDPVFLAGRVAQFEEFRAWIRDCTPEQAAPVCGVDAAHIREAARLYASGGPALSIHGLGLTEHIQGTEGVMCLVNLSLLTGNIGKPGAGINPLRGQNNVQGSAHMGCEPEHLTGYATLEAGRARFEAAWKSPLPARPGLNLMAMMDAAERGELRALWLMGYDVYLTNPERAFTERALAGLECVVIQDMFFTETAKRFGTVFLPACSSFEKDGTFMNAERRVQRVRKAIQPVGDSRPDWQPLCEAAQALGCATGFSFTSAEDIWNEVRAVWPDGAGLSYPRLESSGLQWPCPDEAHPGDAILHTRSFRNGPRAALRRIAWRAPIEQLSADFPMLLTTGRLLWQFNAGTMTMRTDNIVWRPTDTLDLSAEDAARANVSAGEIVRIVSRHGAAELPVRIVAGGRPGEAFATFHSPVVFLNQVTGPERDNRTATPQYKVTAIRIEKLPHHEPDAIH